MFQKSARAKGLSSGRSEQGFRFRQTANRCRWRASKRRSVSISLSRQTKSESPNDLPEINIKLDERSILGGLALFPQGVGPLRLEVRAPTCVWMADFLRMVRAS